MMNLIYGNAFEEMKKLESNSIDLILTDPPYNVSKQKEIRRGNGKYKEKSNINLNFGDWDYHSVDWTDFIPEFVRLLKPNGALILFYEKIKLGIIADFLKENYNFEVRHIGAMVKRNPAPQARKVKWQNGVELFLIATKNKGPGHHFNYSLGQRPDYFLTTVNYNHYGHPTCKPLEVVKTMVEYWSFENDLVLDPFMGTGTTGLACKLTNRNFIGIENNETYFQTAQNRILGIDK